VRGGFGAVVVGGATGLLQLFTIGFMSEEDLRRRAQQMQAAESAKRAAAMVTAEEFKPLTRKALWDFVGGVSFVALALALRPIAAVLAFAGPIGFVLYYLALFFVVIVAPRYWIYGVVRSIRVLRASYSLAPARKLGLLALSLNIVGLAVWLVFAFLRTVPWIPSSMRGL
jgi:hypothetical protein